MTPREYLVELGVQNINHSGRTFYEHLCNVEDILKICRLNEDVQLAGLYHSIYGTSFLPFKATQDREKIKAVIGERAEYLAWLFCNARRPFCWFCGNNIVFIDGTFVTVDNQTLFELQMIEGANLLDQQCGADLIATFFSNNVSELPTLKGF